MAVAAQAADIISGAVPLAWNKETNEIGVFLYGDSLFSACSMSEAAINVCHSPSVCFAAVEWPQVLLQAPLNRLRLHIDQNGKNQFYIFLFTFWYVSPSLIPLKI